MKKIILYSVSLLIFSVLLSGCKTVPAFIKKDPLKDARETFFSEEPSTEAFRVFLSSEGYEVKQVQYEDTMEKIPDPRGDNYIVDKMTQFDVIDEICTSLVTVWLYPDRGRIMKIRPGMPTYLIEIDSLIQEDIQRWELNFPDGEVFPPIFDVKYKVVLQKKITSEEIRRRIMEETKLDEEDEEYRE